MLHIGQSTPEGFEYLSPRMWYMEEEKIDLIIINGEAPEHNKTWYPIPHSHPIQRLG